MNAPGLSPVVVVIAVQGDKTAISSCVDSALADGLEPFVFSTREIDRSLRGEECQVITVASNPLAGVRASVNRMVNSIFRSLASLTYRATRAARHRLSLPTEANRVLELVGQRGQDRLPKVGSLLVRRFFEPLLKLTGFVATKLRHSTRILSDVDRLVRDRVVVGVVCIDDGSLLPGWLISRRHRALPVVVGYPERWTTFSDELSDQFRLGGEL